jgi:ubiquitin-protein ligase
MHFPHDYPWRPPKVKLETTDGDTVRFNPNLYASTYLNVVPGVAVQLDS